MTKTNINKNVLITVAVASLLLCSCADSSKKEVSRPTPTVQVATPLKKSVEIWDTYVARIDAVKYVEVRARVGGYLSKVNFAEGEAVNEGDLLFVIDPRPYEAAYDAAKASVKEVESRVALAKNNLDRAKGMLESNAVSKEVYETRNAELLGAEASLLNAKARLRDAELNLEFTHVKAPFKGRVSEALVDPGNLVNANSTMLTTVVRSDLVQAYFEISERDFVRYSRDGIFKKIDLKKGTGIQAEMVLMGDDDVKYKAVVNYYDNALGKQTSSLTMRADIDNSDYTLLPGMFAKINVLVNKAEEKLLVPESVIGTDLLNRFVMVVNSDNKVEYRAVKVGRLHGKYRIIEDGIGENDRIVVVGLHNALSGAVVEAVPAKIEE